MRRGNDTSKLTGRRFDANDLEVVGTNSCSAKKTSRIILIAHPLASIYCAKVLSKKFLRKSSFLNWINFLLKKVNLFMSRLIFNLIWTYSFPGNGRKRNEKKFSTNEFDHKINWNFSNPGTKNLQIIFNAKKL